MSKSTGDKTNRSKKIDLATHPIFGKYELSAPGEVRAYLKALSEKARMVTVYRKSGEEFFLSTILAVNTENNQIFIERARQDPAWLKEGDNDLLCDTDIDRIQIQFTLEKPESAEFEGEPVWAAAIPNSIIRLQRREFFRLSIPTAKPVYCKIKGLPEAGKETRVELADISGSGMGFSAPIELSEGLSQGKEYTECELALPGEPPFTLGITVRNTYETTSRSGIHSLRVGAEFTKLSPARVNLIQRYITSIERERRARAAGDL